MISEKIESDELKRRNAVLKCTLGRKEQTISELKTRVYELKYELKEKTGKISVYKKMIEAKI